MAEKSSHGWTQSFSASHIVFAEFSVEKVKEMELEFERNEEYSVNTDEPKSEEQLQYEQIHDSLAIYAGISSIAYLDSHINEVYYKHIGFLDDEIHSSNSDSIADWQRVLKKYHKVEGDHFYYKPTLEKYQTFLSLIDSNTFDKGATPYQYIQTLVKFRNYFIHYQTEPYRAFNETERIEHNIGSSLQGLFELNPMVNEKMPYFPDHCLSHGFAKWAVDTAKEFIKDFYEMAKIEPFPTPATRHTLDM